MNIELSLRLIKQMSLEELRMWSDYYYFVMMNKPDSMNKELTEMHMAVMKLIFAKEYNH